MRRWGVFIVLLLTVSIIVSWRGRLQSSASSPPVLAETAQVVEVESGAQVIHSALWRTDAGFASTVRIQNALVTEPVQVTPVLYFSDGTPYRLPAFELQPDAVVELDLNELLSRLPFPPAGPTSEFGSVSLFTDYEWPGALHASVQILDAEKSMVFTHPLQGRLEDVEAEQQRIEGLWWKDSAGGSGFMAVTNATDEPKWVALEVSDSGGDSLLDKTLTLQPHQTELLRLEELLGPGWNPEARSGGLSAEFFGRPGDILAAGGVFGSTRGYSADIPLFYRRPQVERWTYAAAGIMTGKPGTESGFPQKLRFTPFAALRNTTSDDLEVELQLHYTEEGQAQTVALPLERLEALESRWLDFQPILARLGLGDFQGELALTVSFTGHPGDLIMALGSVDETGDWVLQAHPEGVGESLSRGVPFWTVAEGNDTRLSLWNPTDAVQDLLLWISYNVETGAEVYKYPIRLEAGQSKTVSFQELIAAQLPDLDGNRIPPEAERGRAVVAAASSIFDPIRVVVSAATLNLQRGTCSWYCISCSGYRFVVITPSPYHLFTGTSVSLRLEAHHSNGSVNNVTTSAGWSSNNTSIVSLSSSVKGKATGVGPGATTVEASINLQAYNSYYCNYNPTCGGSSRSFWDDSLINVSRITIWSADVTQDKIQVQLEPIGDQGTMKLVLIGPGGASHTIRELIRSGGTYTETFDIPNLPEGKTFDAVNAAWTFSGFPPGVKTFNFASGKKFKVLGMYEITQYNTPKEADCTGAAATACTSDINCAYTQRSMKSDFISQTKLNGHGNSTNFGLLEWGNWCWTPAPAGGGKPLSAPCTSDNTFAIDRNGVTGTCGQVLTPNAFVAKSDGNEDLACSDKVFIHQVGTREVADRCPACATSNVGPAHHHLDHYAGQTGCKPGDVLSLSPAAGLMTLKLLP